MASGDSEERGGQDEVGEDAADGLKGDGPVVEVDMGTSRGSRTDTSG